MGGCDELVVGLEFVGLVEVEGVRRADWTGRGLDWGREVFPTRLQEVCVRDKDWKDMSIQEELP